TPNARAPSPPRTLARGGLPSGSSVGRSEIAVTPADPNTLYVSFATASTRALQGLYKSTDGGTNWANLAGAPGLSNYLGFQGWYDQTLAIDPANANVVY